MKRVSCWRVFIGLVLLLMLASLASACNRGPEFEVSDLVVKPAEVFPNEPVQISVVVSNIGDTEGTNAVTIDIDGVTKETQEAKLAAGENKSIVFTVTEKEGTHTVSINSLTGTFVVKKVEPLEIITESIPTIELCTFPKTCPGIAAGDFVLEASGGIPPYTWSWEFPTEIIDQSRGFPGIFIVYNRFATPLTEGIAKVVLPLDSLPDGKIGQSALIMGKMRQTDTQIEFPDPVFYPEKVVRVPVTVRVADIMGSAAYKKFDLRFTMAK